MAASLDDVIAAAGAPDVAVLSATIGLEQTTAMGETLLRQGINAITLEPALFEGLGEHAERLEAAGREGGASFTSSGMQDHWWVHLPAVAAGAQHRISKVVYHDVADISFFPESAGEYEAAVGYSEEQFAEWREWRMSEPPVQGGAMAEAARLLGLTPLEMTQDFEPIRQDEPAHWTAADRVLQPGEITGARYIVTFATQEGPAFEGNLICRVLSGPHESTNSIHISGEVEMDLVFPAWAAQLYVPLGLVRRLPDLVAAEPGFVPVRTMGPARYVHVAS